MTSFKKKTRFLLTVLSVEQMRSTAKNEEDLMDCLYVLFKNNKILKFSGSGCWQIMKSVLLFVVRILFTAKVAL